MTFHKTGVADAESLTFIGDGAPWIWNVFDEIIEEMHIDSRKIDLVLDFYHASQHLWDVIDTMPMLSEKQKKRLFNKTRKQLKDGKIDFLMEFFGQKANRNDDVFKELRYFHNNEDKCRYDSFIAQKIPISSGAVESAVRRIVNLRLKGAGMFWLTENAEAFLHLRCQLKTRKWTEHFIKIVTPM